MRNEPSLVHPLVVLGLLAACGGSEAPIPLGAAEPVASAQADPASAVEPVPTAEPSTSRPSEAVPPSAAPIDAEPTALDPSPVEPSPAVPSTLHVVAVREGSIDLFRHRDAPVAVVDGEPIPWVGDRFRPQPRGARGLPPSLDPMVMLGYTSAVGGTNQDPAPTWVTMERHYDRVGSISEVYQRRGNRWRKVGLRKKPLIGYYGAYVEREGALLGLQAWDIEAREEDHEEPEDEEAAARQLARVEATERTLRRAKRRFVRLSGAEIAVPEVPPKALPLYAASTTDGTVYAISSPYGEDTKPELLMWPPGTTTAEVVPVPGLDHAWSMGLSTSGDWVLAHGSLEVEDADAESFLAVGRGRAWERIPTVLPNRFEDADINIFAAARTPAGELWIALGVRSLEMDHEQPVWRKPVDGDWELVPLPQPKVEQFGPSKGWIFEGVYGRNDWFEMERDPITMGSLRVAGLVWASGAVWMAVELGSAFGGGPTRTMVLTTRPTTTDPVLLPPNWETELVRHNALHRKSTPGSAGCETLSLVLGPASLATERPELAKTVDGLELDDEPLGSIYTGTLDGASALVVRTFVFSEPHAEEVRAAVADATGLEVKADCRLPLLETMVSG